jgi:hypothetical protein
MEDDDKCLICFDVLDESNSVEFTLESNSNWLKSRFCLSCVKDLQETQFQKYCDDLAGTTCAKEQKKLLERGPPVNIFDKHGFPQSNGCEICRIRRCSNMIVCDQITRSLNFCLS